jgi:hypothetical protein
MKIAVFLVAALALAASILSFNASFAQTPPTATEAFNLRIRCKDMALKKLEEVVTHPMTYQDGISLSGSAADVDRLNRMYEQTFGRVVGEQQWSHYNPKTNRCYIEIYVHKRPQRTPAVEREVRPTRGPPAQETEVWFLFDAQMDELLAQAETNLTTDRKDGTVFDTNANFEARSGWDAAMAYINAVMADPN